MSSAKQTYLDAFEREHATTMRVLRAFPVDKSELQPHPKLKNARELAFMFARECGLGTKVLQNKLATEGGSGMPPAPAKWEDVLAGIEKAHGEFGTLVKSYSDEQLNEPVKFFSGPKQMADLPRIQFLWFLLHDQIHHRGQLSVYLRMADGKVPSIYGPTADEPWM